MKYLHVITKDQFYSKEFIDIIQSKLKIDEHKFIIIKRKDKNNYINPEEYQNIDLFTVLREENILKIMVSYIKFFTIKYMKIRKLLKQADNIFVHFLTEEISLILFRFGGKAKIFWVIWGDDLYKYLPLKLYDDYTLELLNKLKNKVISLLKRIYYSFNFEIRKAVIKRLDYVISPIKGDVKLLKKCFKTKAKWYSKSIYPNPVDFENLDLESSYSINEKFKFKKNGGKYSYPSEWINRFIIRYGENIPFEDNFFDCVSTYQTLEHVHNLDQVLKEMIRVTKSGGDIHIKCPDYLSTFEGHYLVPWFPLFPKRFARAYLRILKKPTYGIYNLQYTTRNDMIKRIYRIYKENSSWKVKIFDVIRIKVEMELKRRRIPRLGGITYLFFLFFQYLRNLFRSDIDCDPFIYIKKI